MYQAAYNHTKDMYERLFGHDSPIEKFWDRATRELGKGYKSEVLYLSRGSFNPMQARRVDEIISGAQEATLSDTYKYAGTSLMGNEGFK